MSLADFCTCRLQKIELDIKKTTKNRKRCAKDNRISGVKLQKRKKSPVVALVEGCSSEVVDNYENDSEATLSDDFSAVDASYGESACFNKSNPWGQSVPELVLLKIFGFVVSANGALPFLTRYLYGIYICLQLGKHQQLNGYL